MKATEKISVTILLPAGLLPLEIMAEVQEIAKQYQLRIYLSSQQNIRLTEIKECDLESIKSRLTRVGAEFNAPGKFPLPRLCIGKDYCKLGFVDTELFGAKVVNHFKDRTFIKAKIKLAIAGCNLCCSNIKMIDIGVMATRNGYEVYTGGKGGAYPKVGLRVGRRLGEEEVIHLIQDLIDYHDRKTDKKRRMYQLLAEKDFPFPVV